jgi:CheY-like chemotaxis protein
MGMAFQDRVRVVLADDNREIISAVRLTLGERVHIIAAVDDGKQAVLAVLEFNSTCSSPILQDLLWMGCRSQ